MTKFAQALARIEEIRLEMGDTDMKSPKYRSLQLDIYDLLYEHADSIVQLGKVAAEMREYIDSRVTTQADPGDALVSRIDKLMKGE